MILFSSSGTQHAVCNARRSASRAFSKRIPCLFLLAVSFHMALFEMGPGGADGWSYFAITESIWIDGDLDLADNNYGVSTFHVVNGRAVTKYPPGTSLLAGPFVLAGRLVEPLAAGWSPPLGARAQTPPYDRVDGPVFVRILAVTLAHNVETLLGLLLIWRALARLGFPTGAAVGAAALAFFATPMLFYAQNGMSEAPSFLVASLAFWLMARLAAGEDRARLWAALGAAGGLGLLVHYRNGLLLPAAAALAIARGTSSRARAGRLAGLAAGAVPFVALLVVYNHVQWGAARAIYPDERFRNPFRFGAPFNIWLAPEHGLFLFHPAALPAVLGLMLLWRRPADGSREPAAARRIIAGLAGGVFLVHSVVCGGYPEWHGPGNFSHHYLTPLFPFLAAGSAAWLTHARGALPRTLPWMGAAWTYALFLLAMGRLVYDSDGSGWGLSIADYAYVFKEGVSLPEILHRIAEGSYTLKALF